jgi:hypothetical protein
MPRCKTPAWGVFGANSIGFGVRGVRGGASPNPGMLFIFVINPGGPIVLVPAVLCKGGMAKKLVQNSPYFVV